MSEKKERKNPWRFAFLACALYGAVKLLGGLWVNIVYWFSVLFMEIRTAFVPNEADSIGIIGGADGPTAIFITAPVWLSSFEKMQCSIMHTAGHSSRCFYILFTDCLFGKVAFSTMV